MWSLDFLYFFCILVTMTRFCKRLILICCVFAFVGCNSIRGTYTADVYGDKMVITFLDDATATLSINGEDFPAQIVRKDGVIELWQMRKTPAIYLKKINENELRLLNSDKAETEVTFSKN